MEPEEGAPKKKQKSAQSEPARETMERSLKSISLPPSFDVSAQLGYSAKSLSALYAGITGSLVDNSWATLSNDSFEKWSSQATLNLLTQRTPGFELDDKIATLRKQVAEAARQLEAEKTESAKRRDLVHDLRQKLEELQKKHELAVVLQRIHPEATQLLLTSTVFREKLLGGHACKSFVLSVDIRRSTELMLKARMPQLYANFITELAVALRDIVIEYQGIFDKFTGDGILAFFPDFYSGEDAGLRAVACADKCHAVFKALYERSRHCFQVVPIAIGLGVGIDYGETHLVTVGDGLTVVGVPVVYACRIGGAPAGTTLLNQPAFEQLFPKYSAQCRFTESKFEAKHEGDLLVYSVRLVSELSEMSEPA